MISPMTTARTQQRYDHRLRELVQRTGDVTIATDLGVPRSTARGWLDTAPTVVVRLELTAQCELELRQEVLKLRRHVQKLAGLLRLALVLLRVSGFTLSGATARWARQAADPARHRAGSPLHPVASIPAASPFVAESVPRVATATHRVCARRSVVVSAHVTASTDAIGDPGDRRPGDVARVPSCSHRDARGPGPAARHGLGVCLDLVPSRPAIRRATAPAPRAPR